MGWGERGGGVGGRQFDNLTIHLYSFLLILSFFYRPLPLYQWIIHYEIIFVGIVGGISSSYSAINAIATGDAQFTVPCYVNATAAHG